jgi:hypothetical protein
MHNLLKCASLHLTKIQIFKLKIILNVTYQIILMQEYI